MNVIRYKDRDVILWTMPDGSKQPFYKSSGRNSQHPGVWFPFDGFESKVYGGGWFNKRKFCGSFVSDELHRFGEQKYKDASEEIEALNLLDGKEVETGDMINAFLTKEGWELAYGS